MQIEFLFAVCQIQLQNFPFKHDQDKNVENLGGHYGELQNQGVYLWFNL